MRDTITIILGGGRGERLYPLTRYRSKPAVPLGGKFRLVDVPISNALHAGLRRIFILTQFNSASLHRHIHSTYTFGLMDSGFVDILAASQTLVAGTDWYEGTADAVRKTLSHLQGYRVERVLILSGDQLYRMDFEDVISEHVHRGADVTLAGNLVGREDTRGLGIMKVDKGGRITGFVEKPQTAEELSGFGVPGNLVPGARSSGSDRFAASMGIYVWELEALRDALSAHPEATDFGHEIIPAAIGSHAVFAHLFDGYWEDVGTIERFYAANLMLARPDPPFQFYHHGRAIFTRPRYLPPARVRGATIRNAILADGADLDEVAITNSVVGIRQLIRRGAEISDSVLMGADEYPSAGGEELHGVPLGIGEGTFIRRAIVDKNAHIGNNVSIEGREGADDRDEERYHVRDGIVVIPKGAVIPDETRIQA